jgi:hypothetical protein
MGRFPDMNARLDMNVEKNARRFGVRRQPYHPVRLMTIKDKTLRKGRRAVIP